jgi:hypothetical protein
MPKAAARRKEGTPRKPVTDAAGRRVIVSLPGDLHRRIKVSCASRGIPMSEAIRDALKRTPWPVREAA